MTDHKPYLEVSVTTVELKYNPDYGDSRICVCGHEYYRHFDSYETMAPVGCKYCECYTFQESKAATMREILIEQTNRHIKENHQLNPSAIEHLDDRKLIELCFQQLQYNSKE